MRRVVVILTDAKQEQRGRETIQKIRTTGQWRESIVWVSIDFVPHESILSEWDVQVLQKPSIDIEWLSDIRKNYPIKNTDGREVHKLIQFSKWRVFDTFFHQWDSMLYIDAGMHVFHPIDIVFSVPHKGFFVAPDDRFPFDDPSKNFRKQWDAHSMPSVYHDLEAYCDAAWLDQGGYFLNCMWLMDTRLINETTVDELCAFARRFPISRTNEMAVMNLYFHKVWKPLPHHPIHNLFLFDWTERFDNTTDKYILLKYPHFP